MSERTPLLGSSPKMFSVLALVATCVLTCALTFALISSRSEPYSFVAASSKKQQEQMGGDRDTTLKLAKHITFQGLVANNLGNNKYEASGVRIVGDSYYVVFDNIFDIGKIAKDLPFLSNDNVLLTLDNSPKGESQYEGIAIDLDTHTFFLAQEAVEAKNAKLYHANISEVHMGSDSYRVNRACLTEIGFESANKGIEGIAHVRVNGNEYLLGLCEGNHCEGGKKGKELGNGRVIVMAREDKNKSNSREDKDKSTTCSWKTLQVLEVPKEAKFQDYSDIAVHPGPKKGKWHVAILSQENSQVWLGYLLIPEERDLNATSHHLHWSLETKAVYDFPRDDEGKTIYCNVEGVDFFNDDLVVVVSDRMKGGGDQPIWCLDRDQSIHVFSLP